jgi:hypothetical protein
LGQIRAGITFDGFVKSPFAVLRFTFAIAAYLVSTSHSSGFVRLAPGAFYFAIPSMTFNGTVKFYFITKERPFQANSSDSSGRP